MFFLYFFNGRLSNTYVSEANGAIFTKISGLVDRCKGLFNSLRFFDFSRDVAGQPISQKNRRFSRTNLLCRTAIRKL